MSHKFQEKNCLEAVCKKNDFIVGVGNKTSQLVNVCNKVSFLSRSFYYVAYKLDFWADIYQLVECLPKCEMVRL